MADATWITTKEAAEIGGYREERIRELLRAGRIAGQKFGPIWQVDEQSLRSYMKEMELRGERRGRKPDPK
ncbi:MAG: helix-turn-helix domain-containing protein [Anaerolineales bacterium]